MIMAGATARWGVAAGVIAALALAQFALPDYHHTNLARIMVLATFAIGYNIAFGYAGLLSLGHAMFFAAGLYGAGMTAHFLHFPAPAAFAAGAVAGLFLGSQQDRIVPRGRRLERRRHLSCVSRIDPRVAGGGHQQCCGVRRARHDAVIRRICV